MTPDGSYRIGEARYRDVETELARLRLQAELAWSAELGMLERHGLHHGAHVLEAGCGPGFVTALLSEYLREGTVTALDVDPTMLAHARQQVGESEAVRFVEGSVLDTGLPSRSFDVVLARLVLQHVPDAPAALLELRRVLRPGAPLIVVDADHAFSIVFDPEPPFVSELLPAIVDAQRLQGGDPHIGRRLPRMLVEAGFSGVAIDAVVAHSVVVGRERLRRIIPDQALHHLEASGAVSAELASAARAYLARVDAGEQDFDGMSVYLVVSGSA